MNQYGLKKVRSQVAGFSLALLIASMFATGVAQAATFSDVQPGIWYYDFVEDLALQGIIDSTKTNFEPGRQLNRAEMAKLAVDAFGYDLETPTVAPFKDVPLGAWYTPYIATAVKYGIVGGYKVEGTGEYTGYYGPADSVTREQAVKIISLAAPLTISLDGGPHFSDVPASRWSYEFVETSYNWSVIDGYTNGNFGPSDNILRAQAAKLVSNALAPVARNSESTETSVVTGGDLKVTLNSGSPAGTDVPCDAQSLVYAKFNFGAGSQAVNLQGVTVKRVGLGSKDDFSKVWFEDQDGLRVTARQTVGSDDYSVLNFNQDYVVESNKTVVLSLVAKLKAYNDVNSNGIKDSGESCYTGRNSYFQIENADAVAIDGGDVGGNFPVAGNTMKTADYSTANVSATVAGSAVTYQVGELAQEFAQWKLTNNNSTRDVLVKTLTIKNEGTGRIAKDLDNFAVVVNGTTISEDYSTSGEYVTFLFDDYVLQAGKTDTFYVRADVVGMDSSTSDNIQFTVRYPEDFNAIESTTGFGVNHNLDTIITTAAAKVYTINGGDTTFVKASTAPSSQTKPKGATAVTFLDSNLIVKQDFTTDAIKVKLISSVDAGGAATLTAADLKNIKLYVDSSLVQTKSGDVADFTSAAVDATLAAGGSSYVLNFDSTVTLKTGTRSIKLVGDIESNAVSGHIFRAEIAGATAFTSAKYVANDRSISAVAGTVTGGDVTIGASKLTITENSGFTAGQKFVAGAQNMVVAKYTIKANDSDDVKVTKLQFDLLGTKAPATNTVSGADLTSASVFVGGVQKGSTKSFTTGTSGSVQFNDVNFTVPANQQVSVELKVSMTNSASGTLILDLAQIDAQDSSSTDALINTLANATYQLAANTVDSVSLAIVATGKLSIAANSNSASSAYVVANSVEQELGKFTLSAQDDDIKLTNLYLRTVNAAGAASTLIASRISEVTLYNNAGTKIATGVVNGNYIYFDMGDASTLIVPKNTNNYTITVKAKFNSITQDSQSGTDIRVALSGAPTDCVSGTVSACDNALTDDVGARAVSASNNSTLSAGNLTESGTAISNALYLTKTAITTASVDDSSLVPTTQKLAVNSAMKAYAFSVTADANGDAELSAFNLNLGLSAGVLVGGYKVYATDDQSNVLTTTAALAAGDNGITFNTAQRIAAGTTKTYIVELNVTAAPVSSSLSIKLAPGVADLAFSKAALGTTRWSDFSNTSHSSTPAISLDWYQGYKIKGLDSMGSRSYSNF